ncbi:hypothetical protein [Nocardia wallacei]|uniref:hypothetical protein n=1 Tax=Nocardia wallacei TaxID=480035 RepID=UPI002454F7B1|nr:hypothetical protein [Nocardia wallacei]
MSEPLLVQARKFPPTPTGAITERDAAVLNWLGEVHIADTDSMREAYTYFGRTPMTKKRLSQRLLQLSRAGQIGSQVLYRGNNRRVYYPVRQPYPIARRDLAHDLITAHMSITLLSAGNSTRLHHNRDLSTEQRTQRNHWTRDVPSNKNAHVADGLLWLPDHTTVIVEIELTPKSTRRLSNILASHANRLRTDGDPAAHILYLTTRRVGQVIADAWRNNGHAVDHPHAMQIMHAVDDVSLSTTPGVTTIQIPDT